MRYPIPSEAFDDRIAFVGTSGSGKTYAALGALARLLKMSGSRAIMVDALGAMWGLRAQEDGKTASGFDIVIFGGPHGDLPINEHSGALIGETVATMRESVILDLSELGSDAAERRFMLAFLTKLYRNVRKDLTHLVFDEADMWAPQMILDREGEAMKLLGMMKTIVRRGRLRGFVPWLITQRPAELSKGVLSMMDGLVAMGMTGEQDRDAVGGWIKGQADKKAGQAILDSLPGKQIGEGVVWIPRRKILLPEARFPANQTFDSSRAPKRGEKRQKVDLPPLDLTKLQAKMATVLEEAKANDPAELRRQLAATQAELAKAKRTAAPSAPAAHDPKALTQAYGEGFQEGWSAGTAAGYANGLGRMRQEAAKLDPGFEGIEMPKRGPRINPALQSATPQNPRPSAPPKIAKPIQFSGGVLEGPLQRIVDSIRWWNVLGIGAPSQVQVAFVAGYSHKSGTWSTYLARLRGQALVEGRGELTLTDAGTAAAREPAIIPSGEEARKAVLAKLDGPLVKILTPLLDAYPNVMTQAELASAAGYSHASGTWSTYLARARGLDLIEGRGELKAQAWLFPGGL